MLHCTRAALRSYANRTSPTDSKVRHYFFGKLGHVQHPHNVHGKYDERAGAASKSSNNPQQKKSKERHQEIIHSRSSEFGCIRFDDDLWVRCSQVSHSISRLGAGIFPQPALAIPLSPSRSAPAGSTRRWRQSDKVSHDWEQLIRSGISRIALVASRNRESQTRSGSPSDILASPNTQQGTSWPAVGGDAQHSLKKSHGNTMVKYTMSPNLQGKLSAIWTAQAIHVHKKLQFNAGLKSGYNSFMSTCSIISLICVSPAWTFY